jgi:hypothetical protein
MLFKKLKAENRQDIVWLLKKIYYH